MSDFDWIEDIDSHEFKVGDIVTVPVSTTGRGYAKIESPLYHEYHIVIGIGEEWRRWVMIEDVKPTELTCECEIGFAVYRHNPNCKYMIEHFGQNN